MYSACLCSGVNKLKHIAVLDISSKDPGKERTFSTLNGGKGTLARCPIKIYLRVFLHYTFHCITRHTPALGTGGIAFIYACPCSQRSQVFYMEGSLKSSDVQDKVGGMRQRMLAKLKKKKEWKKAKRLVAKWSQFMNNSGVTEHY